MIFNNLSISQNSLLNKSYISTDLLSGISEHGYVISAITGTNDNGFAYLKVFPSCAINSDFSKFKMNVDVFDTCCFEKPYYRIESGTKKGLYLNARSLLFKIDRNNKIQWTTSIFNERFPANGGIFSILKQTKDNGFIALTSGRIIKLDSLGKIKWKILFDRDSIPNINKSQFLNQAAASDIIECNDGSYVALLGASFSLLKISKEGKPLWLKSTVFDEFSPVNYEYFSFQDAQENNADTIYLNEIVWNRGGGVYIPTYNVYEAEDGGYIAIGQNMYRDKNNITLHKKGDKWMNKTFCVKCDFPKKTTQVFPEKIYAIRHFDWNHPLTNAEKVITGKKYTTVVVKTDKNGKVEWTKQFGEMNYATNPKSTLLKLANGKWLVSIVDCDSTGLDNWNKIKYGPPHSEIYIIDNKGKILKKTGCGFENYYGAALASDSSYYFFSQCSVTKLDKEFRFLWSKGFGHRAIDSGVHGVTADGGVLCEEEGKIYKFDKFGNDPPKDISATAEQEWFTHHFKAYIPTTNTKWDTLNNGVIRGESIKIQKDTVNYPTWVHIKINSSVPVPYKLLVKSKGFDELKNDEKFREVWLFKDSPEYNDAVKKRQEYMKSSKGPYRNPMKSPSYLWTIPVSVGLYNNGTKQYEFDLSDTNQVRGLFLQAPGAIRVGNYIEVPKLYGYKEIFVKPCPGESEYYLIDPVTEEIVYSGSFTYKYTDPWKKPEIYKNK